MLILDFLLNFAPSTPVAWIGVARAIRQRPAVLRCTRGLLYYKAIWGEWTASRERVASTNRPFSFPFRGAYVTPHRNPCAEAYIGPVETARLYIKSPDEQVGLE